jgi:MarR family transcriptional regulator, 2-MHQ and catechol-resistance regulon repressor
MSLRNEWEKQDVITLILRSQRAILKVVRESAAKEDLTVQQFGILRLLGLKGEVPMTELSEELKVSAPVVTGIIDRLEGKGLVKRLASSSDRRKTEIILTQKGTISLRRIQVDYRWLLREWLENTLAPHEQEALAKLLEKFGRAIQNN